MIVADIIVALLAWVGAGFLMFRLWPRNSAHDDSPMRGPWPRVSIMVPARNEEKNLPNLLYSLTNLDYPNYEILVVDDGSTDQTRSLAESYGVRVIQGSERPEGWNGKNWACHEAIPYATGEIFLFTDADTTHLRDGLKRAVSFFLSSKADMLTALPYHRAHELWEKWLGPFHAFLLAATSPASPKPKRLFAIGQYLMFSQRSYAAQGGHAAVFNQYPDDLSLANTCLARGGNFQVYKGRPFFQVHMYAGFLDFIQGWRRNFLAGLQQSSHAATLETVLYFFAVTGGGRLLDAWYFTVPSLATLLFIGIRQKKWGDFSWMGILLFPLSLVLFTGVTLLALKDAATGNTLRWKGRNYTRWTPRTRTPAVNRSKKFVDVGE